MMRKITASILGLAMICIGDANSQNITVLHAAAVNDTIPNAQSPGGLVRVGEKGLVAEFSDGGDMNPGAKAYLVRSEDLGKTWGDPYMVLSSDDPDTGVGAALGSLPDGRLILVRMEYKHLSGDQTMEAVWKSRTSTYSVSISSDGGKTFVPSGTIPGAPNAVGGLVGPVVELKNGDLIWAAYQYANSSVKEPGHNYGSGFFRSKDGGKTWGQLELAFQDPPPGSEKPVDFNESGYAVRPDGSIVGYGRIDSEISATERWQANGNHMWCVESRDNGLTWTAPKRTEIGGLYPVLLRLNDEQYLMACGDRHESPTRKVRILTSPNALDFKQLAYAPYALTNGVCLSSATGGSQFMVKISDDTFYMIYYLGDPKFKTRDNTLVEGCLIRVNKK